MRVPPLPERRRRTHPAPPAAVPPAPRRAERSRPLSLPHRFGPPASRVPPARHHPLPPHALRPDEPPPVSARASGSIPDKFWKAAARKALPPAPPPAAGRSPDPPPGASPPPPPESLPAASPVPLHPSSTRRLGAPSRSRRPSHLSPPPISRRRT